MSQELISLNADLKRLRDEGYEVAVMGTFLVVHHVPYVNSKREVAYGKLISNLHLQGNKTIKPDTHVAHFAGEYPCNADGTPIAKMHAGSQRTTHLPGLVSDHSFSSKPDSGYPDYYEKMSTYIRIIHSQARLIDSTCTPNTFAVIETEPEESVFQYLDTASSRAGISAIAPKLAMDKVAVIGAGGTGAYILDFLTKTLVKEIHIFDGDVFSQHNAFRAPGAATLIELRSSPKKVDYYKNRYSNMHRGVVAHGYYVTEENVGELAGFNFVFLALDKGNAKAPLVAKMEELGIPFIDVGMGVTLDGDGLRGMLRVTASTKEKRDHFRNRVSLKDDGHDDDYGHNIQVAELNAMNAAMAILKWKKICGYYHDLEKELTAFFTLDVNEMDSVD